MLNQAKLIDMIKLSTIIVIIIALKLRIMDVEF